MSETLYDIPLRRIDGSETTLAPYRGEVLLIVNVASQCGKTPQYAGLETMFEANHARGFEVLGFPANDFGAQEPGTEDEIKAFCETTYGVRFPMFAKITVKGAGRHPLYQRLLDVAPPPVFAPGSKREAQFAEAGRPSGDAWDMVWNFEKFLVGRDGRVVARFDPDIEPDDPALVGAVTAELAKG